MKEPTKKIRLSEYADLMTVTRQTALRWYNDGKIQFPTYRPSERIILVEVPVTFTGVAKKEIKKGKTVAYCRVSTEKQKDSLQGQKLAIYEYANKNNLTIDSFVEEVGSGFNENRKKISKILEDPEITTIIVEHRERFARSNFNLFQKLLHAQDREILVVKESELSDDLVTEITEYMVSVCGKIYGRRGAQRVKEQLEREQEHEERN